MQFYYEDTVIYIGQHALVFDYKNESTEIYKQMLQNVCKHYVIITNQYRTNTYYIICGTKYGKIFSFDIAGLRAIHFMQFYTMLQEHLITSINGQIKNN